MSAARPLRLGTRGSALARIQSELIAEALGARGHQVELVVVVTEGDVRPPDTAWGEGAFVGALEHALLDGSVDLAVHSAKDVPTGPDGRLVIAAYPVRADPRDALVLPLPANPPETARGGRGSGAGPGDGDSFAALVPGARVGTDSPRRSAFLRAARPDLRVVPLHGNVDTRLRRLDAGDVDALVLAVAGLARLGRGDRAGGPLEAAAMPPAPGQGALAVQCRAADGEVRDALGALDDVPTRIAVEAERALLRATGGGCRAPLGALATLDGEHLAIVAAAAARDGHVIRGRRDASAASSIACAEELAAELLASGFRGDAA